MTSGCSMKAMNMFFEDDELDRFGLESGDVLVCGGASQVERQYGMDGCLG